MPAVADSISHNAKTKLRHAVQGLSRILPTQSFWEMSDGQAVRAAFNILLQREPGRGGYDEYLRRLSTDGLPRKNFLEMLRSSEEFRLNVGYSGWAAPQSLHLSRCEFIRSLPRARKILDLGGSHFASSVGALITMGYPYSFDELVIVDLPSEMRHESYQGPEFSTTASHLGTVRFEYHSMTELDRYANDEFDLVYSGQSIEHISEQAGKQFLNDVFRLLKPGGWLALDTPNARATRLQQDEFIDPDHEVEYYPEQLEEMIASAGFRIVEAKGLNYLGKSLIEGKYSADEMAFNQGVYSEYRDCYLLAYLCQRPPTN